MELSAGCSRCEVCYYITGHGLGHATRSLELIRILLSSNKFNVHVVTHVKSNFFTSYLQEFRQDDGIVRFSHHSRALDTGACQLGAFVVDVKRSLQDYKDEIEDRRHELVSFEVSWLVERKIKLVLVDATPLGCKIGQLAGATTILISNFSWDFCFKEMLEIANNRGELTPEQLRTYEAMISQCEIDSCSCSYYLQLPGGTPLPAGFDALKLVQGPLLARGLRNSHLRADLGISGASKVLLLGFGGHSTEWQLDDSFLPEGWICLVLGTENNSCSLLFPSHYLRTLCVGAQGQDMPSSRFRALSADVHVPDYIHLSDAVLGKLGYGFVSECLTLSTALIYVPRQNWPEERYLEVLCMCHIVMFILFLFSTTFRHRY